MEANSDSVGGRARIFEGWSEVEGGPVKEERAGKKVVWVEGRSLEGLRM